MWACFSEVVEIGMETVVGYARWDHKDHLGLVLVGRVFGSRGRFLGGETCIDVVTMGSAVTDSTTKKVQLTFGNCAFVKITNIARSR